MRVDRRTFLKFSALSLGLAACGLEKPGRVQAARQSVAILYDASRCVGCRACQMNCKAWNGLPHEYSAPYVLYESPRDLSARTWTLIKLRKLRPNDNLRHPFWNVQCMHCTDAACVRVCPTGAMYKHELGFTAFDRSKCNGCGYCTQFCPFHVPRLEGGALVGAKAGRCTFCQERVTAGRKTACVEACPVGALTMGPRSELLQVAKARVDELKADGFPQASVYGEQEAGGLSRLSILVAEPDAYGLVPGIQPSPAITLWQDVIRPLGPLAMGVAVVGVAAVAIIARRHIRMEEVE